MEERPSITYADVGGCKEQIEKLREVVELPLLEVSSYRCTPSRSELTISLNVSPISVSSHQRVSYCMVHRVPARPFVPVQLPTEQTVLSFEVSWESLEVYRKSRSSRSVIGSELVQKYIGEGARMVRELFEMARSKKACIIFFDEVDAIGGARFDDGAGGDNEVQRTMLELINQLDGFDARGNIKVIMATNR